VDEPPLHFLRNSLFYRPELSPKERIMHQYTLAVKRDFVARHFLVGGDWGAENELHSHHYQVEVQLEGKILDEHGYLVDIVALEAHLEELLAYYRDQTLNDLPEFAGLNPSIEHFARLLGQEILSRRKEPLNAVTVKIWENDIAWAAYREER
jgi:6-pyruvoyltetrahydropterin/6-carboxytetrahydropterin synthase